jgi:hypothetical protein
MSLPPISLIRHDEVEGYLGIGWKAVNIGQYQPNDRNETDIAPLYACNIRLGSKFLLETRKAHRLGKGT